MSYGIVYKITNINNGKIYIGQTTRDIATRWQGHIWAALYPAKLKKGRRCHFHNAILKHGKNAFFVEQIASAETQKELDALEVKYIAEFNSFKNGYNSTTGGEHPEWRPESRRKIKATRFATMLRKKTFGVGDLIAAGFNEEEIIWITGKSRRELEALSEVFDFVDENDNGFFSKPEETVYDCPPPFPPEPHLPYEGRHGDPEWVAFRENLDKKSIYLKPKHLVLLTKLCNPSPERP